MKRREIRYEGISSEDAEGLERELFYLDSQGEADESNVNQGSNSNPRVRPGFKGTLGAIQLSVNDSVHDLNPDVGKSLDEIVAQRGILRPPKYSSREQAFHTRSLLSSGTTEDSMAHKKVQFSLLDPSTSSLHELIRARQHDPLTSSLDDIIDKRGIAYGLNLRVDRSKPTTSKRTAECIVYEGMDTDDPMEGIPEEEDSVEHGGLKRSRKRMSASTAYQAVTMLSEMGMVVETKIGKLKESDDGDKLHLWRCVVSCGLIEGVCDSLRKVVAREYASHQFLTSLHAAKPPCEIPKYEVANKILIDPRICDKVIDEAANQGVPLKYDASFSRVADASGSNYKHCFMYFVGEKEFLGYHMMDDLAKLDAARQAYEYLTNQTFPLTAYFTDEHCDPLVDYDFMETETFQTVALKDLESVDDSEVRDFPAGKFKAWSEDQEEFLRQIARRKQFDDAKKAKQADEESRRYMQVDINSLLVQKMNIQDDTSPKSLPDVKPDVSKLAAMVQPTPSPVFAHTESACTSVMGRGRGCGRGRKIVRLTNAFV